MEIFSIDDAPKFEAKTAVAIGAFDGVHLGHRVVIDELVSMASQRGLHTGIVTFDRHPASVVRPDSAPKLLCDSKMKTELLATTGVEFCAVISFDEKRSSELAEEFVKRSLVEIMNVGLVVVGSDFHFGHGRKGDLQLLQKLGTQHSFDAIGMELTRSGVNSVQVSSTRIRQLLVAGKVEEAAILLGRMHEVRGVVVRGDARGRQLGFPTANVEVPGSIALPADGVYAGLYVRPNGHKHVAAISVGRRPTFYEARASLLVEAHLLDFEGDLYDEYARVQFSSWIRGQEKFAGVVELIAQLNQDVSTTRDVMDHVK